MTPSLDCFNVANSHTVLQRIGRVGKYDATGATPDIYPGAQFQRTRRAAERPNLPAGVADLVLTGARTEQKRRPVPGDEMTWLRG